MHKSISLALIPLQQIPVVANSKNSSAENYTILLACRLAQKSRATRLLPAEVHLYEEWRQHKSDAHRHRRLLASTASKAPSLSTSREQASPCEKRAREGMTPSGSAACLRTTIDPCSRHS